MMRCYVNLSYMVKLLCLWFMWITLVQTSNFDTVFLCSWHMWDKDSLFVNVWTCVNTYSWQQSVCDCRLTSTYHLSSSRKHSVHHLRCWGTGPLLKRRTDSKGIMIDEWRCLRLNNAHLMCRATRALWNQADCNKLWCIRVSSSTARLHREANWHRQVGLPYSPLDQVVESKLGSNCKRCELAVLTGARRSSSCTRAVWPQTPSAQLQRQ